MNKIIFILSFSILVTSCGKQNGIPSTTQKEVVKTEQEKKEEAIANPYVADDGEKYEAEELKTISLDIVKKWIAAAK